MVRGIVLLLTALPMLMPPGMCVCQFVPRHNDATCRDEKACDSAGDTSTWCKCSTHSEFSQVQPAGEPVATSSSGHVPHEHAPGCPAALGTTPNKMLATPVVLPSEFGVATAILVIAPDKTNSLGHFRSESISHFDPPLFLTHCSLVL